MDRSPALSPVWASGLMAVSWLYWKRGTKPWWSPASLDPPLPQTGQDVPQEGLAHEQGAGRRMGGRLCPRDPSHTMICAQLCLAALSLFPGKLGCPSTLSWKLGGTLQRDRTNVFLLWGLGWLAEAVTGEKQTGRWQWMGGIEQPWTPVPGGTWHYMALPTVGAFCIIKIFPALPAVLLGLCSPEQSF